MTEAFAVIAWNSVLDRTLWSLELGIALLQRRCACQTWACSKHEEQRILPKIVTPPVDKQVFQPP